MTGVGRRDHGCSFLFQLLMTADGPTRAPVWHPSYFSGSDTAPCRGWGRGGSREGLQTGLSIAGPARAPGLTREPPLCAWRRVDLHRVEEVLCDPAGHPLWTSLCSISFWIPLSREPDCSPALWDIPLCLPNPFVLSVSLAGAWFVPYGLPTDVLACC